VVRDDVPNVVRAVWRGSGRGELPAEGGLVEVVDEGPLPVDLDDREPLAVRRLQPVVPGDVDLRELEAELVAETRQLRPRAVAEMAPLRVEHRDPGYGYNPRVTLASATREMAAP
jgi:hypothetical protein